MKIKNVSCDLLGLVFRQEHRDGTTIILETLAPFLRKWDSVFSCQQEEKLAKGTPKLNYKST